MVQPPSWLCDLAADVTTPYGVTLEIGCGAAPLKPWINGRYIGLDITAGARGTSISWDREWTFH